MTITMENSWRFKAVEKEDRYSKCTLNSLNSLGQ